MNKFIVYQGNNGRAFLIPALERRGIWTEASEQEAEKFRAQFIWKQTVLPIRVRITIGVQQVERTCGPRLRSGRPQSSSEQPLHHNKDWTHPLAPAILPI